MHLRNGLRKIHGSFIYILFITFYYITRARINLSSRRIFAKMHLIARTCIVSARMRCDDGGEETEEPEDSFHVGS